MRVFLDENMRPLRTVLDEHEVSFVEREGWKGKRNGELLALVGATFDVLVTSDGSIEFQNELRGLSLSLVVVPTNNLTILRANAAALRSALNELVETGRPAIVTIDWRSRRTLRPIDDPSVSPKEIAPVPPFASKRLPEPE